MDDLRSLEGVGQLLQTKLHQKLQRQKLWSRVSRACAVASPSTPSTPSSSISEYFPPEIAYILGNAIESGYHRHCPSAPMLIKHHSAMDYRNVDAEDHPFALLETDEEIDTDDDQQEVVTIHLPAEETLSRATYRHLPLLPQSLHSVGKMNSIDNIMDDDDVSDLDTGSTTYRRHAFVREQSPDICSLIQPSTMCMDLDSMEVEAILSPLCATASMSILPHQLPISPRSPLCTTRESTPPSRPTPPQLLAAVGPMHSLSSTPSGEQPLTLMMRSNEMNMMRGKSSSIETFGSTVEEVEEENLLYLDLREEYMEYEPPSQGRQNNIGNGASGIVSKAFHYKSCQMVAIKHCRSRQHREQSAFGREAALYRQFEDDPHIVNMQQYFCDIDTENRCIAMELMDLGSSDSLQIDEIRSIPNRERTVAHIMYNVLRALDTLHQKGFIHNDVKPANVLCNKYGEVKLSDFGTVKRVENPQSYLTKNCGTQRYQSPEKLMKRTRYNTKSDIWSLGVSCFELLFGPRSDGKELSYVTNPPSLDPIKHGISAQCSDFVRRCLTMNEQERPSAEQLLRHDWIRGSQATPLSTRWPWLMEVDDGDGDNDGDLLFMIGSLVCYYSRQSVDFRSETVPSSRLRRSAFSDHDRIGNMARYALCSRKRVVDRIRGTVAHIKSSLNKADISRIDT